MPLKDCKRRRGKSKRKCINENTGQLISEGREPEQAYAIANELARNGNGVPNNLGWR